MVISRALAAMISIGVVGATLEPIVRAPDDDGFPLSTFPMFAIPRPAELAISYAQGVSRGGELRALAPQYLGTGEVMQAFARLQRAVDAGPAASSALCAAIAARVATDADHRDVIAIRLVTGTYDAADYAAHGAAGREVTRASCAVRRVR